MKVYINGDGADVYQDTYTKIARTEDGTFSPTLILVGHQARHRESHAGILGFFESRDENFSINGHCRVNVRRFCTRNK